MYIWCSLQITIRIKFIKLKDLQSSTNSQVVKIKNRGVFKSQIAPTREWKTDKVDESWLIRT